MKLVKNVTTNVLNVSTLAITVINVLVTEWKNHIVIAQPDIITSMDKNYVHLVDINVKLVLETHSIVDLAQITLLDISFITMKLNYKIVNVVMDTMMMVSMLNVNLVVQDV